MVFRSAAAQISAHAKTEDEKLKKELARGPCLEGTLRSCSENPVRLGLADLRKLCSESSRVAATIENDHVL
jgi:hypothetical protein